MADFEKEKNKMVTFVTRIEQADSAQSPFLDLVKLGG